MLALILSLVAAPPSARAEASTSLIGMTVAQATATEFFGYFHLTEVRRVSDSTKTQIYYRPGVDFKEKVGLWLVVDTTGIVRMTELQILRELVDNPATQLFARDLAKSYLLAVSPEKDQPFFNQLAQAIWLDRKSEMFAAGGSLRSAEDRLMRAYRAFLDGSARYDDRLQECWAEFFPSHVDGQPALLLSIGRL